MMRSSKIDKEVLRTCASRCAEFLYDMHGVLESTPTCSMHDIIREVESLLRVFVMLLKGTYTKCTLPRPRTSKHFGTAIIELGVTLQILRMACKAFSLAHVSLSGASASAKVAVVHSAIDLNLVAENLDTIRTYLDHLLGIYGEKDATWWFQYLADFRTSAENISTAARASGDITTWMAAVDKETQELGPTVSPMGMDEAEHERECSSPTETQNVRGKNDLIKLERYLLELKEHIEILRSFVEIFEQVPLSKASQAAAISNDDWQASESTAVSEDSAASRAVLIRDIKMREAELARMYEKLAIARAKCKASTGRWDRMTSRISTQRWVPIGGMKMKIDKNRTWIGARERN